MTLKGRFFYTSRRLHKFIFLRDLPANISVYFHNILEHEYEAFQKFISYFQQKNYIFVGPDEILNKGKERKIFVSFDDNYNNWYKLLPVLDAKSVKVTFYTNSQPFRDRCTEKKIRQYYGRLNYNLNQIPLSSEELKEIYNKGHIIGGHTHSHYNLNSLSEKKAVLEIKKNKFILEDLLQTKIEHFAFPYGMRRYFNHRLKDKCKEIGFETVANAIPGMLHHNDNQYNIYRTQWNLSKSLRYNIENLKIDACLYAKLTGRSFFGGG